MPSKVLNLEYENPKTKIKSNGKIEIRNQTSNSADLYFYGDICSSTWDVWQYEDMCPQDVADFLNSLDGVQTINIYINSGGGDSFAGIAIYNMLKRNTAKKDVYVEGIAASAASPIALIGALEGNSLHILSGAQLMIHNAWTIAVGNANDFRKVADTLDKVSQSYIDVYAENAIEGIEKDQIKQMMDDETWLNGEQAAQYFKNITIEGQQIAAYADSQYFNQYKTIPGCLLSKREPQSNNGPIPEPTPEPGTTPEEIKEQQEKEENLKLAKAKLALQCNL